MPEAEIRAMATAFGVADSGVSRVYSSNILRVKPSDLDFVEILLQNGEAVAVQRGNLVTFTTAVEFGPIRMLCGAAVPTEKTLFQFDRNQTKSRS